MNTSDVAFETPAIVDVLGGQRVLRRRSNEEAAFERLVLHGLPGAALRAVGQRLKMTNAELAAAFGVTRRGMSAILRRQTLTPRDSARTRELAQLVIDVTTAFGDENKGVRWLRKPNLMLDSRTPLDVSASVAGRRLVDDALGRVMYGTIG